MPFTVAQVSDTRLGAETALSRAILQALPADVTAQAQRLLPRA